MRKRKSFISPVCSHVNCSVIGYHGSAPEAFMLHIFSRYARLYMHCTLIHTIFLCLIMNIGSRVLCGLIQEVPGQQWVA